MGPRFAAFRNDVLIRCALCCGFAGAQVNQHHVMRFDPLSAGTVEHERKLILVLLHLCIAAWLLLLVPCVVIAASGQCQSHEVNATSDAARRYNSILCACQGRPASVTHML